MNELSSLGLILLFALMAGHLAKSIQIPEVVGYLLAGVAVGPSGLGWVSHRNLDTLSVFSEVALGLILFSVGTIFEYDRIRRVGAKIVNVTLCETGLASGLVFVSMLAFGLSWQAALLLGAIAMETAPASTLMVIRESHARGPLTETLLGVVGVNNILTLTSFTLAAAIIDFSSSFGGTPELSSMLTSLHRSLYPLLWQLFGSAALGFLVGLVLAWWAPRVHEHGQMLILLTGTVLSCVGGAQLLDLSTLVASLAVGATMVNLSADSRRLFAAMANSDPPFFAIFFVIAGADLELSLLRTIGIVGLAFVSARIVGKLVGCRIGARREGLEPTVQKLLGFGLIAQAGLAIGLTITVNRRFPDLAPEITTVVLAAVIISELIGPIATRLVLHKSGEAQLPGKMDVLGRPAS